MEKTVNKLQLETSAREGNLACEAAWQLGEVTDRYSTMALEIYKELIQAVIDIVEAQHKEQVKP